MTNEEKEIEVQKLANEMCNKLKLDSLAVVCASHADEFAGSVMIANDLHSLIALPKMLKVAAEEAANQVTLVVNEQMEKFKNSEKSQPS
jgi:hypothetical protein